MKITIKTIEFRGFCRANTSTGADQYDRYTILLDSQANSTVAAAADFWSTADVYGMRNLAFRKRFKTIYDKALALNSASESGSYRAIKFYLKFRKPIVVEYNTGTAGTVGDIASNSLYFITIGNVAAGTSAGVMVGTLRLRYQDM